MCARAHAHACAHVFVFVCVNACVCFGVNIYACVCVCMYVSVCMCMYIYVHHAWNINKIQGEHSRSSFLSLILNKKVYNMYYLPSKPYKDQETRQDINTPWMAK